MKNITIAVDDDTYRAARIAAAEQGTSVSALVKRFLQEQGESRRSEGVRELPMTFTAQPASKPAYEEPLPPGAYGRFPDGAPYYTPDGKPRQPGAMRGLLQMSDDFDEWPEGFLDAMYGDDTPASRTWWMKPEEKAQHMATPKGK